MPINSELNSNESKDDTSEFTSLMVKLISQRSDSSFNDRGGVIIFNRTGMAKQW